MSSCTLEPWATAIRERWTLSAVRRLGDDHVVAEFSDKGEVVFNSWMESWRELGDGRYFVYETWLSGSDDAPAGEASPWPRNR